MSMVMLVGSNLSKNGHFDSTLFSLLPTTSCLLTMIQLNEKLIENQQLLINRYHVESLNMVISTLIRK